MFHQVENVLEGWTFPNPDGLENYPDDVHQNAPGDDLENRTEGDEKGKEKDCTSDEKEAEERERKREKRKRKELKRARKRHLRSLGR